jgi:hypothetical protein
MVVHQCEAERRGLSAGFQLRCGYPQVPGLLQPDSDGQCVAKLCLTSGQVGNVVPLPSVAHADGSFLIPPDCKRRAKLFDVAAKVDRKRVRLCVRYESAARLKGQLKAGLRVVQPHGSRIVERRIVLNL